MATVHDLRHLSMGDAYDATQTRDDIKHGDVLLVEDGVAILDRAWPVMVRGESKVFHALAKGKNWYDIVFDQPTEAKAKALLAGLDLAQAWRE